MIYRWLRVLIVAIPCAVAGLAHYTWVAPPAVFVTGKTAIVQIAHGHRFPHSEEIVNPAQLQLFVLAPSGNKVALKAAAAGNVLTMPFPVQEAGFHRIVLVQDRGITSRTPGGLKAGGRDRNKNASQAYRTLRTAVAYANTARTGGEDGKPAGLEFELTGVRSAETWLLQVLRQGNPVADAPVEVLLAGASKAVHVGTTGPDGRIRYQVPSGNSGPAVFSVTLRQSAPPGATYDFVNYETSLYVSL
jgi:hypothetical protein